MNLPRPMKADDISDQYFHHDPNTDGSFFAQYATSLMEPKVDGVRAYLVVEDGVTRITIASSESTITHELPQLYGLEGKFDSLILDGELLIPGERLGPLVGALNSSRRKPILDRAIFFAFDLLDFNGSSLRGEPLSQRRAALEIVGTLFPTGVQIVPQYPPSHQVADAIRATGFEGFMLKSAEATYHERRHHAWLKCKWLQTIDCFVTDWQPGRGGYEGLVGALHMSVYDENGNVVEIGKHGVFPERLRRELTAPDGSLKPEWRGSVMELTYQDIGTDMRLRHPRLYRLRPDKRPTDCEITQLTNREHTHA